MARSRTAERREAIMAAATRVFASGGLGAPTAIIAREAGVSNGSLFTYFPSKAELLNQLFVELKTEMAAAVLDDLPGDECARTQLAHAWSGWVRWASDDPARRRTLAQLAVSDEVTAASRARGQQVMAGVADVLERSRAGGSMADAPLALVAALMGALADATVDQLLADPANADHLRALGFEAMWRMLR